MPYAPPVDYARVRTTLCQGIALATGLGPEQIIMAQDEEPGAILPPLPFVMFQFTAVSIALGNDSFSPLDAPDAWQLSGPRQATVLLNCYGRTHDEAYNIGCLLQAALYAPNVTEAFSAANMAVWDAGQVVDLSALLSTGYEGRVQMVVKLGLASILTVNLPAIESVPLLGTVSVGLGEQLTVATTITEERT